MFQEASIVENIKAQSSTSAEEDEKTQTTTSEAAVNLAEVDTSEDSAAVVGNLLALSPATKEALVEISRLVDEEHLVPQAERELDTLNTALCASAHDEFATVLQSPQLRTYMENQALYCRAGLSMCERRDGWFTIYKDSEGMQHVESRLDESNPRRVAYRISFNLPSSLSKAMLICNEVELSHLWQKYLLDAPKVLGKKSACRYVVHSQMAFFGGLYKGDTLNEIKRFVDTEQGIMVETIKSVEESNPQFFAVPSGFRRASVDIQNLWVSCGPSRTLVIQNGDLHLPVSMPRWVLMSIGMLLARGIMDSLRRSITRVNDEANNPWASCYKTDACGLYALLQKAEQAPKSLQRATVKPQMDESSEILAELLLFFREKLLKFERFSASDGTPQRQPESSWNMVGHLMTRTSTPFT